MSSNFNMNFDPVIKQKFSNVVTEYGLTVPQAFKLFANQVIKTGVLPLSFNWANKPNRETLEAINELENGRGTTTYDTVEEAMEEMLRIAKD